jgi:hypothetical protein
MINERLRPVITPFPEEYGMGWGLDVTWSDLVLQGYRLGVVDRVSMLHHGSVGAEYDAGDERARRDREFAKRSLRGMSALSGNIATWRSWGRLDPRERITIWRPHLMRWKPTLHRLRGHFLAWMSRLSRN